MSLHNWSGDVRSFLHKNGFIHCRTKSSHFSLVKETERGKCVVIMPFHGNKSIPIGTMYSIVKQSGIQKEAWVKIKK